MRIVAERHTAKILCLTLLGLAACSNLTADPDAIETLASLPDQGVSGMIEQRADIHRVPSASITVISDQAVKSHYIGDAHETALMQAASLSKTVAAVGILILMDQEGIEIDADIRGHFTSIDISALPGGDRPLTVRELLSHTAGANQSGYPGYRRDRKLPSSLEVITDPPSRLVSPVILEGEKGTFDYSGGGYQLAQLLAEDISGQPFAELMSERLFKPLQMNQSTFIQPISAEAIAPSTILGAQSGIRIREGLFRPLKDSWHNYPEQAAAGLWTTPENYARFIKSLLKAARGEDTPIPSSVAKAMLTPVGKPEWAEDNQRYGLGLLLTLSEQGDLTAIHHSGLNAGYRSLFEARLPDGPVIVSLSNAPGGVAFNEEIVSGLIQR